MTRAVLSFLVAASLAGWLLAQVHERPTSAADAAAYHAFVPGLSAAPAAPSGGVPGTNPYGVPYCAWIPGTSQAATMPPDVVTLPSPTPAPTPAPPKQSTVPAGETAQQQDLLQDLWAHVEQTYVDPLFNGIDWDAVHDEYAGYTAAGLTDAEFAAAMNAMLLELGDQHSHYQSAQEVAEEAARLAEGVDYVGIGVFGVIIPESGAATLVAVFPGSPAAGAGLRPHDVILSVNGKAPIEPDGTNNLRGPAGTIASLSVQRPGGQPFTISLVRAPVAGSIPVDYCLVKGTKVGYIMIPTLLDATIGDQVGEALEEMARAGMLSGIILDNRMDGGGLGSEAREVLSYFIDGPQGGLVSRTGSDPFIIDGQSVGGSQSAQLIVLVDRDTASYGEVTSGILQHAGRATVVGRTTDGNVEILTGHDLEDGSRAWVATYTFEPIGLPAGIWEDTGIVVDVAAPTRWDLFTDANDPAMEKALAALGVH